MTSLCFLNMLGCMRTTLRIDDALFREFKVLAARSHLTLAAVVEEALRRDLAARRHPKRRSPVRLPVSKVLAGLRSGLNIDKTSALLEFDLPEDRRKFGLA